jgi:hypothetical protein
LKHKRTASSQNGIYFNKFLGAKSNREAGVFAQSSCTKNRRAHDTPLSEFHKDARRQAFVGMLPLSAQPHDNLRIRENHARLHGSSPGADLFCCFTPFYDVGNQSHSLLQMQTHSAACRIRLSRCNGAINRGMPFQNSPRDIGDENLVLEPLPQEIT